MLPPAIKALPDQLRERARQLAGYSGPAELPLQEAVALIETAIRASEDEALDLDQAAIESGYTIAHLRRMMGLEPGYDTKVPNAGTLDDPLILRRHLPRKPGHGVTEDILPLAQAAGTNRSSRSQVARAVAAGRYPNV